MQETQELVNPEHLAFWITPPGETDGFFIVTALFILLVVVLVGVFYFKIQALPDRMVEGASKAQMQVVGILGLLSLFTMNNAFWIVALLLAAIRIPDFMTPLKSISQSLVRISKKKS